MLYVLNFRDHSFKTCETTEEATAHIDELFAAGVTYDEITVINRLVDGCEMSMSEFPQFRKNYGNEENDIQPDFKPAKEGYRTAYCNCCGTEFDVTDDPVVCPECGAEYDPDRPNIVELYR